VAGLNDLQVCNHVKFGPSGEVHLHPCLAEPVLPIAEDSTSSTVEEKEPSLTADATVGVIGVHIDGRVYCSSQVRILIDLQVRRL
jgi:hypothetical protein